MMSMDKINFKFIEIHNFKIYSIYLIAFVQILGKKKLLILNIRIPSIK